MSQDDGRTDQRVAKEELSDLTARCIRCGFCLEACPTYVLTGHETESPRGRIYLVRSAEEGKIAWEQARPHLDRCLGCRACEPACPSGVQYGQILELSRDRLEERRPHRAKRWLLAGVTSPVRLRLQLLVGKLWPGKRVPGWLSRLLSREAPEADLPRALPDCCWPPLEEAKLPPVRGEVYLLEGCAMRVLYPGVHEATRRLLRRVGYSVREAEAGCCGALHAHNGQLEEAKKMAAELASALDMAGDPARPASTPLTPSSSRSAPGGGGEAPLIVNSAGCGSFLKEQPEWEERVFDAAEFLFRNGLAQALAAAHLPRRLSSWARTGNSARATRASAGDPRHRIRRIGRGRPLLRERGHLQPSPAKARPSFAGTKTRLSRTKRRRDRGPREPRLPRLDRSGRARTRGSGAGAPHDGGLGAGILEGGRLRLGGMRPTRPISTLHNGIANEKNAPTMTPRTSTTILNTSAAVALGCRLDMATAARTTPPIAAGVPQQSRPIAPSTHAIVTSAVPLERLEGTNTVEPGPGGPA
jgi:Fe-S oxidoreductase